MKKLDELKAKDLIGRLIYGPLAIITEFNEIARVRSFDRDDNHVLLVGSQHSWGYDGTGEFFGLHEIKLLLYPITCWGSEIVIFQDKIIPCERKSTLLSREDLMDLYLIDHRGLINMSLAENVLNLPENPYNYSWD